MKTSKSAVFLFELMIIILVFTFASAVCAQIFASSYKMSTDSREKSMSVLYAQTAIEKFKAGEAEDAAALYDKSWQAVGEGNGEAYYEVAIENNEVSGHIRSADIVVYKKGEPIYSMQAKVFSN
ncbi:MAG: hypothetical protein LBK04_03285 [Clostridiales Family XIII bacterium]|jgi:hypothetical protein|nr:hypothetical protein [Clostridiales Family XIII bacterium]